MNYPNRGMAVIINNRNFKTCPRMGERKGTDDDAASMYGLLDKMGFVIERHNNLTAEEMRKILQTGEK